MTLVAAALFGLAAVVACTDDPVPAGGRPAAQPGPPAPPSPPPVEGTATPVPPPPPPQETPEQADARMRAWRADLDKQARAVLDRFRSVVYDPSRDGGLRAATGTVDVTVDGRSASYRFAFAGSGAPDTPPTMTTVREDAGIHPEAARQAKRVAVFATRGPASFVLSYMPPLQYATSKTRDGRTLVVAPPFKTAMSVSYRVNDTGLVEMSGATDGKDRLRTVFHWAPRGKLWMLTRAVVEGGKTAVDYEFEERDGVSLLRRASIQEGLHSYDATVAWESIATR